MYFTVVNTERQKLQDVADQLTRETEGSALSQGSMDKIVNEISNIFTESATLCLESKPKFSNTVKGSKRNKPWFGPACYHTRKSYNAARRKYNHERTHTNLLNLQRASKIYKKYDE